MKQNTAYPKTIIHRLGGPSMVARRRSATSMWLRLLGLAMLVFAAGSVHAGTHTWSGAGANTLWSNAANWSSGGAPVAGETNVVLIFPANATGFTSTVNVNNLSVDRMEFSRPSIVGTDWTFPNGGTPLALTGVAGDNIWVKDNGNVTWQPNLTLQNTCRFNIASLNGFPGSFDVQGAVAGNGGLVKQGLGALKFSTGGAANTFTGTLRIESGSIYLNKIVGTPCFGGNLEIVAGVVNLKRAHQIPDTASITIGNGSLETSADADAGVTSVSEVIGPVTLTGTVSMTNIRVASLDTITLGGNVTLATGAGIRGRLWADSPSGKIALNAAARVFNVPDASSRLEIQGDLADGGVAGGFTKQGAGQMLLLNATTFTGAATVAAGTLTLATNQSLGGTAGATTVQAGATLELGDAITGVTLPAGETINLAGTINANSSSGISGPLVLSGTPTLSASFGDSLTHTGVISGSGVPLNIAGQGTVVTAGSASNTMAGYVSVNGGGRLHLNKTNAIAIPGTVKFEGGGTVKLLAPNQIADAGSVWMANGGLFDLNNQNESIGFLLGSTGDGGTVALGDATLTLNGTTSVQLGTPTTQASKAKITGSAVSKIRKLGSNTWTLYHHQNGTTFPTLSVEAGTVELYGEWSGPIEAKGGTLRGSATTGAITGLGGKVCLCDFTAASFSGTGTTLVSINGATPGTEFDRLSCSGPVNLTGQTLQVTLGSFLPMTSARFTIVDRELGDTVVTGTFAGLPEGATFMLNGRPFSITYKGGVNKNDVDLIFLGTGTPGPEITGFTKNGSSLTISVSWLPEMAGKRVYIERAIGASNELSDWGAHGSVILDAQGKGSFTDPVFGARNFFRLRVN